MKTLLAKLKQIVPSDGETWTLSIASLMLILSGCQTPPLVIPADKVVTLLKAGQSFRATNDVYLVPPARMQEILHQLSDKLESKP
jgi:hypothetical protein